MSVSETGLPHGWSIRVSRTHNREYYLNDATEESSWEPPSGTDQEKLNTYLVKFKNNGYKPAVQDDGKIRVSHILIKNNQSRRPKSWKSPDGITRTREESISLLRQFRNKILSGDAQFENLATEESDCSSHAHGGDLGFFGKGEMQPSFEEAAYGLNVGELSDIVESDSGVHLIKRVA